MKNIIIGYGEEGKAVGAVIGEHDFADEGSSPEKKKYDVMHICIPYGMDFVEVVEKYKEMYQPDHVVIYSTVAIGTTGEIAGAVHSPVEGKHPDLELSIRTMERWIGTNTKEEGQFFVNYFEELGLRTKVVKSSDFTEALKLLSTTEYGLNIEFARYKAHVADQLGMDFELTKEWNREYNRLYKELGMDKRFQKFVLDAPDGPKGGHCVAPNAQILDSQYPGELTKIVGEL